MAHARWHTQLPQYGSPGFGSAVSARLRGGASPVRQGLLGMSIPTPAAVGPLKGETEEERKKREEEERKKREEEERIRNKDTVAAALTGGGQYLRKMFETPELDPMKYNLGVGQRQYGGRSRRYA